MNVDSIREASYVGLALSEYRFQVQALNRTGAPGPISDTGSGARQLRPSASLDP